MKPLFYIFLTCWLLVALVGCNESSKLSVPEGAGNDTVAALKKLSPQDSLEALIEKEPVSARADGFFNDFIYTFMTNRRFQTERIAFPLPCYDGKDGKALLKKEDWKYSRLYLNLDFLTVFLDDKSSFRLMKSGDLNEVTLEWFDMPRDLVRDYCFKRRDGRWMMTEIRKFPVDNHRDADFINFYQHFATDSVFQMAHLAPTIHFVTEDTDEEFEEISGMLDADQWPAFRPELPANVFTNIDYGQTDKMGEHRVVLIQGISDSFLNVLYFRRSDNGWTLYRYEN